MARLVGLCCFSLLVVLLVLVDVAVSRDLSEISPVPAPATSTGADSPTSSHPPSINDAAPASAPSVQSPSPLSNSPPAPPSEDAPASSPTEDSPVPSPSSPSSPSPSPADASDINHASNQNDNDETKSSSGGSSKGHKAGIVVGVLGAAVVVGLGGLIYKKRRDNIRRSNYGQAARRELL